METREVVLEGALVGEDATLTVSLEAPAATRIWIPHLTPSVDHVIGDAAFRSPAIVLANHERATAYIPDLDDVREANGNGYRVWLDYDQRAVTLGAETALGEARQVVERRRAGLPQPTALQPALLTSEG